jgi:hypothetical protein
MELTPAQKHLIHGLKLFGLSLEDTIGIMLAMDTPEKRDELMRWMVENTKATPSQVVEKTMDIASGRN